MTWAAPPPAWLWSNSIRTCLQQAGGSPVMTGPVKWPRRCRNLKTYQTPYGGMSVERNVY